MSDTIRLAAELTPEADPEDGRIDLLPVQKRRIARTRVAKAVDRLVAAVGEDAGGWQVGDPVCAHTTQR